MKLEELIKQHEGKTFEFKANIDSKAKLLATIIAFSNTAGGKLVIGVDDKSRQIIGINDPILAEESLANFISDTVEPHIVPNIEIVAWRNTHIIVVDIYPGPARPYYIKSKGVESSTYYRVGSTNRLADREIISMLKRTLSSRSYDEEVYYELNSEAIDFRLASEFFKPYRALTEKDYYSLGILVKEHSTTYPSIGGLLLFGKNKLKLFPDAWMQVGCFLGEDKSSILDSQEIKDSLPAIVETSMKFVQKHLLSSIRINGTTNEEVWSIPKIAIREAVINAIVHADYSLSGAPLRISIFKTRIEIENPGMLPLGLTIEDITSGISKIRNRVITRVFHELHLIEKWGSGIQRMISACETAGLAPPKFEELGTRFRVTLYSKPIKPAFLDKIEIKISELLLSHGALSTKDIAQFIGLSTRSVRSKLLQMLEKGKLVEISRNENDPKKKYALK